MTAEKVKRKLTAILSAEAGGICLSGIVYDQVKNKIALGYEFLGEQTVKNIAEPVRVYRVRIEPGVAVSRVVAEKKAKTRQWRRAALSVGIVLIVVVAAVVIWHLYYRPAPSPVEVASKEKMLFPLPDSTAGDIVLAEFAPNSAPAHSSLAATGLMGKEEEAKAAAADLLRINPKFSVAYAAKTSPYKRQEDRDQMIQGLHKAGLK